MKFHDVAVVFEKIEQEPSRLSMTKLLADLLKQASSLEAAVVSYLSLGSLRPSYIGTKFNFADKSMKSVIASLLDMSVAEVSNSAKEHGDLGSVVMGHEWGGENILTVVQLEESLKRFLEITGTGSQDVKEKQLLQLLRQLDQISAKYVIRIILGKLRLGFSAMTLIDAFSWMETGDKSLRKDLENAYNVSADIGLIAKTLKEFGIEGIRQMSISPGIPILPAAAERLSSAKDIIDKLGTTCVAQPKLDGFRLQVHLYKEENKKVVKFFSRNLQDMSDMFPELRKVVLELQVDSFVAEGEAIAYDLATGFFLSFQETVKRRRKYDVKKFSEDVPLKLYLFDALYLNGESLLNKTHNERRTVLENIVGVSDDVISIIEEVSTDSAEVLGNYFENNISHGLEGVVVKRVDAIYQPGKRNFNWIKLKRQETGSLDDTVDCVILGYYYGHGKRAKFGIGALLVGVFNKKEDRFQTIAKIGTGLSDDEWSEQKEACDKIKVAEKPKNVECAKALSPEVWVDPSIVCQIRADEITLSPIHRAGKTVEQNGFALRFPRIMGYRPDKKAVDATTVEEIEHLFELQFTHKRDKKKKQEKTVSGQKSLF